VHKLPGFGGGLHHSEATAFTFSHCDGSGGVGGPELAHFCMQAGSPAQFAMHCAPSFVCTPLHFSVASFDGHEYVDSTSFTVKQQRKTGVTRSPVSLGLLVPGVPVDPVFPFAPGNTELDPLPVGTELPDDEQAETINPRTTSEVKVASARSTRESIRFVISSSLPRMA
jgi:hypothetical protein